MDYTWALNQTATYWERLDPDGLGGWDWEDPVEIDVRWDELQELLVDANGEEFISRGEVLLNQDVKPGDYLYLGELTSAMEDSASVPTNIEGAWEVKKFEKIPTIDATEFVRTAWV